LTQTYRSHAALVQLAEECQVAELYFACFAAMKKMNGQRNERRRQAHQRQRIEKLQSG
jgi:hypothetical protein